MTGHAGIFAGGDMVPAERNVTVAVGHGKEGSASTSTWLRGSAVTLAKKPTPPASSASTLVLQRRAGKTVRPVLDWRGARPASTRCRAA